MQENDENPKKQVSHEVGMLLDELSLSELEERIILLEAEIVRLRLSIKSKKSSNKAANAAFKF